MPGNDRCASAPSPGRHHVAWRPPFAQADAGINAAPGRPIARTAEAAKFDPRFLDDGVRIRGDDLDARSRTAIRCVGRFGPPTPL